MPSSLRFVPNTRSVKFMVRAVPQRDSSVLTGVLRFNGIVNNRSVSALCAPFTMPSISDTPKIDWSGTFFFGDQTTFFNNYNRADLGSAAFDKASLDRIGPWGAKYFSLPLAEMALSDPRLSALEHISDLLEERTQDWQANFEHFTVDRSNADSMHIFGQQFRNIPKALKLLALENGEFYSFYDTAGKSFGARCVGWRKQFGISIPTGGLPDWAKHYVGSKRYHKDM